MARPLGTYGSQHLRDLFVCLLALVVASPFVVLLPRLFTAALLLYGLLFFTPVPRWLLQRAGRAAPRAPGAMPVVVLGGGFAPDGGLSPRSLRRLRFAVELAAAHGTALVLCGGARHGERTEAEALAQMARPLGHEGPLHTEARSLTTFENLLMLTAIARAWAQPLFVVTCPQHRPRVALLARTLSADLVVTSYPVERLPGGPLARLRLALECFYEIAIHLWLRLRALLTAIGLLAPLSDLRRPHLL